MTTNPTVGSYMNAQLAAVSVDATLNEVVALMTESQSAGVAVFDKQQGLVGVVSEQDCVKQLLLDSYHCGTPALVETVINRSVESVKPDDSILDIAGRISDDTRLLPVMVDSALVGVISHREVLQALSQNHCGNW